VKTAPQPLDWIDDELAELDRQDLLRRLITRQGSQGATIDVDGRRLINFGSNDYLGLAAEPALAQAVIESLQAEGWGAGASPLVTGHDGSHARLEARLAEFEGVEAALVFPSGFAANVGAITALVGRGDAVFGDQKNHASIIDGCRLSRADMHVYPHGDWRALENLLRDQTAYRRRLIVTDSLFSMDGDLAPLADISEAAERHGAMLLVDEAHATGVFGQHGRGVAEHLRVEDGVHVRIGTLSKALGCAGGFVAGSKSLIDWLVNRARPYVFSTAHPAACSAAAIAALDLVRGEPDRRQRLLATAAALHERLRSQGWNVGRSESQIIPVFIGEPATTMRFAARLRDRGLFVPGIRPPSVPAGESLLRISLSYAHAPQMIDTLVEAMAELAPLVDRVVQPPEP